MENFNITNLKNDIFICDDLFTTEELDIIEEECNQFMSTKGSWSVEREVTLSLDPELGISSILWLPKTSKNKFLHTKLAKLAKFVNDHHYHFDITGYIEKGIMYIEYNKVGDYYDWHTDYAMKSNSEIEPAKIIVILQLTDPKDYTGAAVEVAGKVGAVELPRKRGLVSVITGYSPHRVLPLESGKRKVLSAWFTGPNFK